MSMATATELETRIDIPLCSREPMIDLLNQQLADTFDLYSQIKQAHWNVKGMKFMSLHVLFDDLAANFDRYADDIAERATALGGLARGTARLAATNSQIDELPIEMTDGKEFVVAMADRFAAYGASSRAAIKRAEDENDAVTADLFTEITREVNKSLYFLESHLQG
ncbi:DNA protection during starvation protein [Stieleria maiorica]|uniref:DNA protection during starvation protein n=1 Tax=Stieleria maiorica TaxID=2795974 RepID=A0A5B9MAT6_9BACT|nr:DNA starvation/stationary phase protection protein Dps [Stieleria maiorica]QEF97813.1 DNA protection during starvation protein [Stieleria maiorica]